MSHREPNWHEINTAFEKWFVDFNHRAPDELDDPERHVFQQAYAMALTVGKIAGLEEAAKWHEEQFAIAKAAEREARNPRNRDYGREAAMQDLAYHHKAAAVVFSALAEKVR